MNSPTIDPNTERWLSAFDAKLVAVGQRYDQRAKESDDRQAILFEYADLFSCGRVNQTAK